MHISDKPHIIILFISLLKVCNRYANLSYKALIPMNKSMKKREHGPLQLHISLKQNKQTKHNIIDCGHFTHEPKLVYF